MNLPHWGTASLLEIVAALAAVAGLWVSVANLRAARRGHRLLRESGRNGSLLAVSNASVDGEALRIAAQACLMLNVLIVLTLPSNYGWQSDLIDLARAGASSCLMLASWRARRLRHEVLTAHEEGH